MANSSPTQSERLDRTNPEKFEEFLRAEAYIENIVEIFDVFRQGTYRCIPHQIWCGTKQYSYFDNCARSSIG
ncbi:hypothetical protein ACFL2Y_01830 [Candidatus Omnitrophota bacterium]